MGPFYAAAAAFAGALAALAVYHAIVTRPELRRLSGLVDLHDGLLSGGTGTASARLGALEEASARLSAGQERLGGQVTALESLAGVDLSRVGFVRYDAFANAGTGLSYALALLNRRGDGVVLTSIYSREDSRTFGKPVANFTPTVQASAEELEAIERARADSPEKRAT